MVERQRFQLWEDAVSFGEQDAGESRTGARAFIQRDRFHVAPRHAAVELHAEHRSVRGDAGIRDDLVVLTAKVFDARDQRDIQLARSEIVGEAARIIEPQRGVTVQQLIQPLDERLRVEIVHRPNGTPLSRLVGSGCGGFCESVRQR